MNIEVYTYNDQVNLQYNNDIFSSSIRISKKDAKKFNNYNYMVHI